MVDGIKIGAAVLLVLAGVGGFYYLDQSPMIVRVVCVLAGLVAGAVLFLVTGLGRQFHGFARESIAETKKVVWPTRKETLQTTGVVVLFMLVMALFLWAVDASLLWAVKKLLGQVG